MMTTSEMIVEFEAQNAIWTPLLRNYLVMKQRGLGTEEELESSRSAANAQKSVVNQTLIPLQKRRDALSAMESPSVEEIAELAAIRAAIGG